MPKLPSYRNESTDLHRKSVDRFLYDGNFGIMSSTLENSTSDFLWVIIKNMYIMEMKTLNYFRLVLIMKYNLTFYI